MWSGVLEHFMGFSENMWWAFFRPVRRDDPMRSSYRIFLRCLLLYKYQAGNEGGCAQDIVYTAGPWCSQLINRPQSVAQSLTCSIHSYFFGLDSSPPEIAARIPHNVLDAPRQCSVKIP